jgi:cell division septation protein DedD
MHAHRRAIAAAVAFGIALTTMTPVSAFPIRSVRGGAASSAIGANATVPHLMGIRDFGRRYAGLPVRVSLTLNYNHQAELDQLVRNQADRRSPLFHHYLSSRQFNNYFAPTPAQHMRVIAALRAAGFTITHVYPNRTIVDAKAPTAVVERYFGTQIHNVLQVRNGRNLGAHYTNVRPVTVPSTISPLVKAVSVNDLIVAHIPLHVRAGSFSSGVVRGNSGRHVTPHHFNVRHVGAARFPARSHATNIIGNPGFETGYVNGGWIQCGNVSAYVVTTHPHSGTHDNLDGKKSYGEPNGDSGVCQLVTIPSNGVLSAWLYQASNEANTAYAYQEADLLDSNGYVLLNLYTSVSNKKAWTLGSWNLAAYAGQRVYLYFGVHGDGYTGLTTQQYVDDVSLVSSGGATPTPSPTATPRPTPTPTVGPTPTPKPTATPTAKPTATPTAKPTATPTPVPTATPGGGCAGSAAENGALKGSSGWLATGVAKAFDYPVQHGCNGAGQTVGVIIDSPIKQSDITTYMGQAGVTQVGTITNVAVDGGGTYSSSSSSDTVEASLDVETIIGLAPGANIRVYNFPSLSDQSIEDAYNMAVSDNLVTATNSSFGGCETGDTPFVTSTNSIAQQGAAKGITFAASSGDSGSDECGTNNNPPGVSAPASGTYFVGVGAVNFTDNTSTGALATITSGTDSGNGFASGGGVSTEFALPSYQTGVSGMITSGRNSPDVSLPGVGAQLVSGGSTFAVDGTSWSCPEFVAFMAEATQLHGARFGQVLPAIYSTFGGSFTNYTDVTSGTNGSYTAKAGYDQVTGIGAPKGWALANAL